MYDLIIIGAGPAGISASLYAKRANLKVLVLYHGSSQLEKAHLIENYYGFPGGISGLDLYNNGIQQAKDLGVDVKEAEVTHITMQEDASFSITASDQEIQTKSLIIATGNKKLKPAIKGLEDYEGRGVSYCALCDAFFFRKKNVVVIGDGTFALSEADDIANVAANTMILTNGNDKSLLEKNSCKYQIDTRKIVEITGSEDKSRVKAVKFDDGSELLVDGIFIALGEAGACDFAKKLGIQLKGDSIVVDNNMKTNIAGIFSCGNSTGGLLQISKAVYEGAFAGLSAVEYIRNLI